MSNFFLKYKMYFFTFLFCCLVFFLTIYLTFIRFLNNVKRPLTDLTYDVKVVVPHGANAKIIASILNESNLPVDENNFLRWVRFKGLDGKLKSGEYIINKSMSIMDITDLLVHGRSISHRILIHEGMNLNEIIYMLNNRNLIDKDIFVDLVNDKDLIQSLLPFDVNSFEGFFFPDTYEIPKNFGEFNIIRMFVNRFLTVNKDLIELNEYPLGLSFYEVLILASIVEKEAVKDFERPVIAGVYYNRLSINKKLQADPTVIYSLGEHRSRVYLKDLKVDSPYNTYLHHGLPPTPIANPGYNSIKASVQPAQHEYFFFVAQRDGTHYFSRTFAEHRNARRRIHRGN